MKSKLFFLKGYRFEFHHLLVVLISLIFFQILVSIIHKTSLQNLLLKTQDWYQRDEAERMANLSTTSLELLLENIPSHLTADRQRQLIQAFDIILSQQSLQQNVQEICLIAPYRNKFIALDEGKQIFNFFVNNDQFSEEQTNRHSMAIKLFQQARTEVQNNERTYSVREGEQTFHVFVPFVPRGEFTGAIYVKNTPDFSSITGEIITSFNEISGIFVALIFLGLLAMFYISSYTVNARDEAQKLLFQEKEKLIAEQIHHRKEAQFTMRIYHTHHKAEKVMGFIKEDLRELTAASIEQIKYRVGKYANFISRVIYDMKWYEPPVQSIRNPMFRTDLNEVIRFIVENIFKRTSTFSGYNFELDLQEEIPVLNVNEFVVWEIIEPLIQNSIDHSGKNDVRVRIGTQYDPNRKKAILVIADNGSGIAPGLLESDKTGRQRIFEDTVSTKAGHSNSGYGCYIAYEIATQRCNWHMAAENGEMGGAKFTIEIPY
jgi:signal transduction histidine kinase